MHSVKRLYTEFIPHHYSLSLDIDRPGRAFSGTLTMSGESIHGAISVHAKDLSFTTVSVDGREATFELMENDEIAITYPTMTPGEHIVTIGYTGVITDALHGLYPCHFAENDTKKELLVTQFESHYAREVLPCIDEPEAKATFDVSLTTETGVKVLGNMPAAKTREEAGRLVTTFETTPKMSTYLLAFVIGELQSKTAITKDGVDVAVWATKAHDANQLDYALQSAVDCIEFFNEHFGVPYPLPKADHVAVPDFDAGAMENWGLITYRESALLVDEKSSSLPSRQYVTSVIAHELSHQWFGNLVTMRWWNNLWLNESFASIMENIAPHALHPEWNVWLDFSTHDGVAASRRDAIDGVQAVQTDVNHPDEISSLFDGAIVYAKGARLMRMCEAYIGEDAFKEGLRAYFKDHAYSNTDENDLWNALSKSSGKNVGEFMNTWISQSGYPVVHAAISGSNLTLRQEQFFVGNHTPSDKIWPIPLDANIPTIPGLLNEREVTLPLDTFEYLQLNQHDAAHFIVDYDDTLLARLTDAVKSGKLDEIGRLKLLHERVMLSRAGAINPASLVDLLAAYDDESSDPVWDMLSLAIGELKKFVETAEGSESKLKSLVAQLSRSQYERLGWQAIEGESVNDTKLRPRMIANMLYAEDADAIKTAIELADTQAIESLPGDLRSVILGAKVKFDQTPDYIDLLIKRYSDEASPEIKDDVRSALTSARDNATLTSLVALLTDKSIIRPQDTLHWYIYLLSNRHARAMTWQWLQDEWAWIEQTFGSDKSFDYYPRYSGQILSTRLQADEYIKFFTPMLADVALKRTIEMGISDIEGRVSLIEKYATGVQERLNTL